MTVLAGRMDRVALLGAALPLWACGGTTEREPGEVGAEEPSGIGGSERASGPFGVSGAAVAPFSSGGSAQGGAGGSRAPAVGAAAGAGATSNGGASSGSSGGGNGPGVAGTAGALLSDLCGNGVLDSNEQCDDGNRSSGDGCGSTCTVESCFCCPPEICIATAVCGDGVVDYAEACDDGNVSNGDGCSDDCAEVEPGFVCRQPGQSCEWVGPAGCATVIAFADPNLEAVVREVIEMPAGDVRYADVVGVRELAAREAGIADLDGLQCLVGLESLALYYNDIRDLRPLADLTSLTLLGLGFNRITDVGPLVNLSALVDLRLQGNEISDLRPLSGLSALDYLDLGENSITDLGPLARLSSLETLGLFANPVSDLGPLEGLGALSGLQLGRTAVTDLAPLVGNPDFAEGDSVSLYDSPINCEEQAANIGALRDRGAHVASDCP